MQQPVCAAPCAVHLDARATDDPQYTRDFHVLDYEYSCGIAAAGRTPGTWQDGASMDVALGPITGCVYRDPGTYTVRLTVRAPDGETGTTTSSVVVADPNVEYGDASETWCFADSGTPNGPEFAACPTANAANRIVTTSFDSAINSCGARTAHRRCLFRAGDTFTTTTGVSLSELGGMVGPYDAGPAPLITGSADQAIGFGDGWTVTGLRFLPTDAQGTAGVCGTHRDYLNLGTSKDGLTLHELTVDNLTYHGVSTSSGTGSGVTHNDRIAIVRSTLNSSATGHVCAGAVFLRTERALVLGNVIDGAGQGGLTYNVRTIHFPYGAMQHNRIRRPGMTDNNLSLRAWAGTVTGPPNSPTQYIVISDNHFSARNPTMGFMRACQSNTCDPLGANYTDVQHLLVERNFFAFETGAQPQGQYLIGHFMGGDITIRNNVVDAQGIDFSQGGSRSRLMAHGQSLGTGRNQDRVSVLNNTVYSDDAGARSLLLCDSMSVGTGHECHGNLAYVPANTGPDATTEGSGWSTPRGNLFAAATPFAGAAPQQGATTPTSFALSATGPAKDAGEDFATATAIGNVRDFASRCRPIGNLDAGAFEQGAVACSGSTPPPPPRCGDGAVDAGETCDDGNTTAGDGCSATCSVEVVAPACGDGRIDAGELCDDGNLVAGDGCNATCRTEVCGNGTRDAQELCDDGNVAAGDGCNATCRTEVCGNGTRDANEACDDGNLGSGDGCRANCTIERCGDAILDASEGCDDGNTASGDGCNAICAIEVASCGNGHIDAGELCDDGNVAPGDGCNASCRTEVCGNGVRDANEACDDGNVAAGDGCRANCSTEACGDGIRDPAEACDDGNLVSGDGCRAACTVEACGDGIRDGSEACDDGNVAAGDGCSALCIVEADPTLSDQYRTDVGGQGFVDSSNRQWLSDAGLVNGGTIVTSTANIGLTTDDVLYRTARQGPAGAQPVELEFPVPGPGPYLVRLYLAELDTRIGRPGQRVFDVLFENVLSMRNVDIYAARGYARAHTRDFYVNVDDGALSVRLVPRVGQPLLNGIEIRPATPPTETPKFVDR